MKDSKAGVDIGFPEIILPPLLKGEGGNYQRKAAATEDKETLTTEKDRKVK